MQQLGNIIKPQKLTPPDAPTVEVASNNSVSNIGHNIAKALIAFHKTNPFAEEKSQNTFFKKNNKNSTYASLEEVITICRKAVDFDLTFVQNINFVDDKYFVSTVIIHSSGETLSDRTPIKCKDYNDPHKFFGSVSYARRYGLTSSFSIPTADNDGISAMGWDQPNDVEEEENQDVEPDIDKYIENAKSIKELGQIWNKYQPTDDAIKNKFTAKRGELEK
tara:strand:- start:43 stop:702 length:660 start_codon:yes stop_codon:yes gene_type:complete